MRIDSGALFESLYTVPETMTAIAPRISQTL
jgi:hypothetical protein